MITLVHNNKNKCLHFYSAPKVAGRFFENFFERCADKKLFQLIIDRIDEFDNMERCSVFLTRNPYYRFLSGWLFLLTWRTDDNGYTKWEVQENDHPIRKYIDENYEMVGNFFDENSEIKIEHINYFLQTFEKDKEFRDILMNESHFYQQYKQFSEIEEGNKLKEIDRYFFKLEAYVATLYPWIEEFFDLDGGELVEIDNELKLSNIWKEDLQRHHHKHSIEKTYLITEDVELFVNKIFEKDFIKFNYKMGTF